ncbi:hypothetical protein D3C78_581110 [compost metagenome]
MIRWMASRGAFFATIRLTDSGSFQYSSGATSSGSTPPRISTLCQPRWGIIQAARKPPPAAPKEKPQKATVTRKARLRSGAYSEVRVAALGIAAPSPRPVRKRKMTSWVTSVEKAVTRVQKPKNSTLQTSTILRPQRSDSGPATSAPTARPISAALITGPSACAVTPHSSRSCGAIRPITTTSKPSSAMMAKQKNTTSFWKAPKGRLLISSRTSMVFVAFTVGTSSVLGSLGACSCCRATLDSAEGVRSFLADRARGCTRSAWRTQRLGGGDVGAAGRVPVRPRRLSAGAGC